MLLDAFDRLDIATPTELSVANVRRFVEQSRHDASISAAQLDGWRAELERALEFPAKKYEHAELFGRLVMEWLGSSSGGTPVRVVGDDDHEEERFEHVGRKEMYEQRREWEGIVFVDDTKTSPDALETYLGRLFGSTTTTKAKKKLIESPLEKLRESMKTFKLDRVTTDTLKTAIGGILATDLLSEPKRKALADFQNNPLIRQEIADVLNMQIDALGSWSWGPDAVPVIVRRALNGKYRVYADEELIQAILVHHIGISWAVHIKNCFKTFFHSGAWTQSSRRSLNAAARRLRHDLNLSAAARENVRNERRDRYKNDYFMAQLPDSADSTSDAYDDADDKNAKSPLAIKQSLLHLISTETVVQTRLYGSLTILQSDFRWFGPSLPHAAILAVMRFLGVTPFWLEFFEKFLKAPLRFIQDGADGEVRVRKCGVPIQHRLSDALGEAVLFCLDFAVNQSTASNLYRLHDDLWFWGSRSAVEQAWQAIRDFSAVMGLELNIGKTGSVDIVSKDGTSSKPSDSQLLPIGDIVWGFMKMHETGIWVLDHQQIDAHIQEICTQLEACKSIFAWVQAWNMYVTRFLANNFGEPANCLGRYHVDMTIGAFERIQKGVFAPNALPGENVLNHLRRRLEQKFGATDIPDGFFYFPIENGGLGLRNPLIPLLLVRKNSENNPVDLVERAFELEHAEYSKVKKSYEDGTLRSRSQSIFQDGDPFISFDEFFAYAEETSKHLQYAYTSLLKAPVQEVVRVTDNSIDEWDKNKYEIWVFELYGREIVQRYGGLGMGETRLLPIGLVNMLKAEKIRWQG